MSENRGAAIVSIMAAVFLVLVAVFAGGMAVAHYKLWPYEELVHGWRLTKSLVKGELDYRFGRFVSIPEPGRPREMFTVHDREAIAGGYYVMLGFELEEQGYTARLFDDEGQLINRVPVSPAVLGLADDRGFPDPHGLKMLPDGSVLTNFDKAPTMGRIDRCGERVWMREGAYHHSIELTGRGSFWTWLGDPSAYGMHQFMVELSWETGETLRTVPIEDVVRAEGEAAAFFNVDAEAAFPQPPEDAISDGRGDVFHPNDVEELRPEMAAAFPMFEAGDLVISLKSSDMIAVLDPVARRIKWSQRGPWTKQHDPDFLPDGRISVFDNNRHMGTSRVVIVDPKDGSIETVLAGPAAGDGSLSFYTEAQGKHERLSNGNYLIVSTGQGFAAEVDPSGAVVLEFQNVMAGHPTRNAHLPNAQWLPEDYFTSSPVCP
ncbi:MAG: arylsulfotransferase family protein [Pseudomonadota bacterium]